MDRNDWTEYTDADGDGNFVSYEGEAKGIRATDRAVLIKFDDGNEDWIPRTQISTESEVYDKGTEGTVVITKWLAEQRNWA